MATCGYRKDSGGRCGVDFGLCPDCSRCFHHCDHREEERREARMRGGQTTKRKLQGDGIDPDRLGTLRSHEDAERWLELVGHAVAEKILDHKSAKAIVKVVETWSRVHDKGKVSERLEELTTALAEWRKTGDPEPVLTLVEGAGS